jgi:glycosyltransferase involved in cell wall biosynthesis
MRVLVFHGYMLRGTGSNIYNASLARTLVELGHEVHLLCQDRHAAELPFVDAVGSWGPNGLRVDGAREPVRCTVYLPDIGRTLPVYVADEYEGFDAVPFPALDDEALERYVAANVAAVREVADRAPADAALANHAVMGPAVLARAIGGRVPYAAKVHGSALEYTVRPHPERFLPYAREGLSGAEAVLVGSRHTAESLWSVLDDPGLPPKTRLGPPGVDVRSFRPRRPPEAATRLRRLADRVGAEEVAAWGREPGAAEALRALDPAAPIVAYVGKLIVSKGVDLLLAAWPLVTGRVPAAQLCVVGFGTYRDGLRRLMACLGEGDLAGAREIAARGRELEGGPPGELSFLASFLDRVRDGDAECYLANAGEAFERVHFAGRLEHDDLPDLLPACDALVVPSTFPEAFGMVAAEAACCGVLPLSASHSGLAEVTRALEPALEERLRPQLAFEVGPKAVEQIASRLVDWLMLDRSERPPAAAALSDLARRRFGWEAVSRGVLAAAAGRLAELPEPAAEPPAGAATGSRSRGPSG